MHAPRPGANSTPTEDGNGCACTPPPSIHLVGVSPPHEPSPTSAALPIATYRLSDLRPGPPSWSRGIAQLLSAPPPPAPFGKHSLYSFVFITEHHRNLFASHLPLTASCPQRSIFLSTEHSHPSAYTHAQHFLIPLTIPSSEQ